MASTDARPVPIKNTAYRAVIPIYDNTGSLVTGAAGLDSEVSKDQGTYTDCTNEATEIATNSGTYYLDLTATEMNADCVAVVVKTSTTNAKTTVIILYPQESGDIKVDLQSIAGSAVATGSAQLGVNVVNWGGTAVATAVVLAAANIAASAFTNTKFASGAIDNTALAADAISAAKVAADVGTEIADAVLDRTDGVETGWTPRQALRLMLAALAGKLSGAATTTVTIRDVNDAKNRLVATVDSDGNRTAVTKDVT